LYSGSAPEGAHSIDFEPELPRLPIGTLYGRLLRDRPWSNKTSRIVQASQETLDGETLDAVRDVPRSSPASLPSFCAPYGAKTRLWECRA
jgi:hypothetical protein